MILKFIQLLILEGFAFCILAVGAFVLSHLGLLLIGHVDANLSPRNDGVSRARPAPKTIGDE
jgi:hypothetical protein